MIKHSTLILITKKTHLFLVLKKLIYTHNNIYETLFHRHTFLHLTQHSSRRDFL